MVDFSIGIKAQRMWGLPGMRCVFCREARGFLEVDQERVNEG